MSLAAQNFIIYCLQVTILVAIRGLLPFAVRLDSVRARLIWWQMLLGTCLVLPLVQPWKQVIIYSSLALAPATIAGLPVAMQQAARPFPWETVALVVFAIGIVGRLVWLAM